MVPDSPTIPEGPTQLLLVDAANVIGSRPTGWWKDRPGAATEFVDRVRSAARDGRLIGPTAVVLEGAFRRGAPAGERDGVTVVHAPADGDTTLIRIAADAGGSVLLVSSDRALRRRIEALGGEVIGPRWFLDLLLPRGEHEGPGPA